MIELQNVSFTYARGERPVILDASLVCNAGEITLICGATGSGKSTLLALMAGLAPRFSGGTLVGRVLLDGVELAEVSQHERPRLVGLVGQQAEGTFIAATVEEELAFTLEQLGVSLEQMRADVASTAALVGLTEHLKKPVEELSGGQQQRLAIAAAVIARPKLLLLDEPTSELDDAGAQILIDLLKRLAGDLDIAVVIAEHHIERLIDVTDSVAILDEQGCLSSFDRTQGVINLQALELLPNPGLTESLANASASLVDQTYGSAPLALEISNLRLAYGGQAVIDGFNLSIEAGEVVGLVGKNGSGKTTLLLAIAGELKPEFGPMRVNAETSLVPQNAADLLYLETVTAELAEAREQHQTKCRSEDAASELIEGWIGSLRPDIHPRDLSSGQQLALALAIQLSGGAKILLLDEPTRGLDYRTKLRLAETLNQLRQAGKTLIVASHDLQFLNLIGARLVRLDG